MPAGLYKLPITRRKDTAEGTVSMLDRILAFTLPIVISYKEGDVTSSSA
jgi:hypothetical protein